MAQILVMRLTALGDVVLTEPVIRALRAHDPDATIHYVTDQRYAAFVERGLGVDRVVGYDRRGEDRGMRGVDRVRERLDARYDLVIDLQGKLRTRSLSRRFAGARRATLEKRTVGQALLSIVGHDPPIDDRHSVDLYLSVLAAAGVGVQIDRRPQLTGFERRTKPGRVGLSPGATHATKRWPVERFAELASRMDAEEIVLVGGPADRRLLDTLRSALGDRVADIAVDGMGVVGLVETLATLDALVTVDTGPAHIAAALGVPTTVIFGPTSPVRWGPIGDAHRVVTLDLDCAPCSNTGGDSCPVRGRDHACLQTLDVETVLRAVRRQT
ncbi:MAG: glycosyltransferase family 9 protein [Deltaproteobacteria bacterium]